MNQILRKALLITIALLCGVIAAIIAGLLTHAGGGHITATIRDGAVGFAGTSTFILILMSYLGVL